MGTNSYVYIHINGKSYRFYNHFDSNFNVFGLKLVSDIVEVLQRENGLERLKQMFIDMEDMKETEKDEVELNSSELLYIHNCGIIDAPYNNFDVIMKRIEETMKEGKKLEECEYYTYYTTSNYIEWMYVFDLDENTFSVSSERESREAFCITDVPLEYEKLNVLNHMYRIVMDIQ